MLHVHPPFDHGRQTVGLNQLQLQLPPLLAFTPIPDALALAFGQSSGAFLPMAQCDRCQTHMQRRHLNRHRRTSTSCRKLTVCMALHAANGIEKIANEAIQMPPLDVVAVDEEDEFEEIDDEDASPRKRTFRKVECTHCLQSMYVTNLKRHQSSCGQRPRQVPNAAAAIPTDSSVAIAIAPCRAAARRSVQIIDTSHDRENESPSLSLPTSRSPLQVSLDQPMPAAATLRVDRRSPTITSVEFTSTDDEAITLEVTKTICGRGFPPASTYDPRTENPLAVDFKDVAARIQHSLVSVQERWKIIRIRKKPTPIPLSVYFAFNHNSCDVPADPPRPPPIPARVPARVARSTSDVGSGHLSSLLD